MGDEASVAGDWGNAATPATLTRIAPAAEYPPTSVPTEEVHLTRAVGVEFTATAQLLTTACRSRSPSTAADSQLDHESE